MIFCCIDAAPVLFKSRNKMETLSPMQVQLRDSSNPDADVDADAASGLPVRLRTFVESTMDVASASPRRYFFEVLLILEVKDVFPTPFVFHSFEHSTLVSLSPCLIIMH